jgi:hypothetical protein
MGLVFDFSLSESSDCLRDYSTGTAKEAGLIFSSDVRAENFYCLLPSQRCGVRRLYNA